MDLGGFLDTLRDHYVAALRTFVAEQRALHPAGAAEVKLGLEAGSPLFGRRYCADFVGEAGAAHGVRELVPDEVLEFDSVSLRAGLAYVSIESMSWDDVVIDHDVEAVPGDALQAWFTEWFDPDDRRRGDDIGLAIHSLLVEPWRLSLDLGTAPPAALLGLIELLVQAGASSVRISASRDS
ncbi:MAG: hypothetical protein H7268_07430 [Sandarakinorhabdus sp.]|nr:hypothetical protein [Sandarakinorhabdus sp.]